MSQEELDIISTMFESLNNDEKEKLIASITGETIEQRRERNRIYNKSKKYEFLPIKQWPEFKIQWDYSPSHFHLALDGVTSEEFEETYPNSLAIGEVVFDEFDSKLGTFSKRGLDEIWSVGNSSKLARTIVHFVEGNLMTPPIIIPQEKRVNIYAGHHRVAVSKAKKLNSIPVLSEIKNCEKLSQILKTLKWKKCIAKR